MGRLFWKFFLIIWLAQMFTTVSVATLVLFSHPARNEAPPSANAVVPPTSSSADHEASKRLSNSPTSRLSRVHWAWRPILFGSFASFLFAGVFAWYFAKPIRDLRSAFASVAAGNLGTRVSNAMGQRRDELADLGKDFDFMAERLDRLVQTQRRLLHDVSHELRSPLGRLQAAADLMRQQPGRSEEFIDRIERDTARMDKLVGELLTLARLDAGVGSRLDETVDLMEVVGDVIEDSRLEAENKSCVIESVASTQAVVRGDQELLHRAIENVVRNALRHSPQGEKIAVAVRAGEPPGSVRIEVTDHGSGVPEPHLEAIFTPFFRGEPGNASAGYGLGLAITRQVAIAHGGQVSAANRANGGLLVTLTLPLGAASSS